VKPYRRKLSAEDVATGSILITKDAWTAFPVPLQEFTVQAGGASFRTCIVAEPCSCVLPPHEHYHLEAGHFRDRLDFSKGARIVVERHDEGAYVVRNADR
jgi:hypothetical protein